MTTPTLTLSRYKSIVRCIFRTNVKGAAPLDLASSRFLLIFGRESCPTRAKATPSPCQPTNFIQITSFLLYLAIPLCRDERSESNELRERATVNGYKHGVYRVEDSIKSKTKYVPKILRDQNLALECYQKVVVGPAVSPYLKSLRR